jgi:hypothetical protein
LPPKWAADGPLCRQTAVVADALWPLATYQEMLFIK